jgi:hypothetical protein
MKQAKIIVIMYVLTASRFFANLILGTSTRIKSWKNDNEPEEDTFEHYQSEDDNIKTRWGEDAEIFYV